MANELPSMSDSSFEAEVIKSDVPVLVDFWATWCEPCKRIEPVIQELAQHYAGRLKVVKLNVEEHPQTAAKFHVRNMPTFMIFKNGGVSATQLGAVPKSQLMQFIDKAIA
jgi:thioredoxin 1